MRALVLHFNVTEHPTAQRAAQQLVEAFPWEAAPRYLLWDRDGVHGGRLERRVASFLTITCKRRPVAYQDL